MLTHHAFTTSEAVLRILIKKYNGEDEEQEKEKDKEKEKEKEEKEKEKEGEEDVSKLVSETYCGCGV